MVNFLKTKPSNSYYVSEEDNRALLKNGLLKRVLSQDLIYLLNRFDITGHAEWNQYINNWNIYRNSEIKKREGSFDNGGNNISLDTANLFSANMREDAFKAEDFFKVEQRLKEIQAQLKSDLEISKDEHGRAVLVKNWREWLLPWLTGITGDVDNPRDYDYYLDNNPIIQKTIQFAEQIRADNNIEAFVHIGIGGSIIPTRAIVNPLISSQHNLLSRKSRGGAPQVYYTGDSFSPELVSELLDVLADQGILFKTKFNVISKSGTTAETIGTYLVIRDRLQSELQKLSQLWSRGLVDAIKLADMGLSLEDISPTMVDGKSYFRTGRFFVATTGFSPSSVLYTQFHHKGRTIEELKKLAGEERFRGTDFDPYYAILPVPEGMGGRFSGFSPVGLLLLAVTANANLGETPRSRIRDAFFGIDSAIENALNNQVISNKNVAFKTAAISHIAEYAKNKTIELLYFFDPKLADVRVLLNELYSESLQEFGRGIDTKPLVGSMDNHMDWNGIIAGPRNKIIRFVTTKDYDPVSNLRIPSGSGIKGDVQAIESLTLGEVQNSACFGTSSDATKPSRQEQDKAIELPGVLNFSQILNNKSVKNNAEFIFTLMLETAILGKLNGLEVEKSPDGTVKDLTYLQYWVEGYKKAMRARCAELKRQRNDNGGNLYDNVEEIVRIMENYLHVEGNRNTGYSFHVTLTETKDIDVHMHNEDLYGGRVYIILKGSVNTNRFAKGEIHFEYFNIRHQCRKLGT